MKLYYGDILVYKEYTWMYVGNGKNGNIQLIDDCSDTPDKGEQVGTIDTWSYSDIESLQRHISPGKFVLSGETIVKRLLDRIDEQD